jgi:branched-chain amino acid transport system substrate-binding protein
VLVTELDHDGRVGGEDFEKAARELSPESDPVPVTVRTTVDGNLQEAPAVVQEILVQKPEALVFWTGPQAASELVAQIDLPSVPIYLCRKATQGRTEEGWQKSCRSCAEENNGIFTAGVDVGARVREATEGLTSVRANFEQRYQERTGSVPSMASAQAYDAVRLIAAALRQVGPNRARLRDALAGTRNFPGASGPITFDQAGNDRSGVALVPLY